MQFFLFIMKIFNISLKKEVVSQYYGLNRIRYVRDKLRLTATVLCKLFSPLQFVYTLL